MALTETCFAIETLLVESAVERRAALTLVQHAESDTAALEPIVRELERLKQQLGWLESYISYHRLWQ